MGVDAGHPDDIALPDGPLSFVSQDAADERDDAYERRIAGLTAERAADRLVLDHQAESIAALTVERDELRDHADALEANYRRVEAERDAAIRARDGNRAALDTLGVEHCAVLAERDELKTELERTRAEAGRLVGEVVLERDEAVAATADLDTLLEAIAAYKARKEAAHGGPGDLRPLYSTVNEIAKKTGRPGGQDDG